MNGKTFLVTGSNTGIGRETARELAAREARVFLACRSEAKGRAALDEISRQTGNSELCLLSLDLGDFSSVRSCAEEFISSGKPLCALINNAGLAGQRGLTKSGFELHFGTNFVGHFLLTHLLLDRLRESAPARIVNIAVAPTTALTGSTLRRCADLPRASPACRSTRCQSWQTSCMLRSSRGDLTATA